MRSAALAEFAEAVEWYSARSPRAARRFVAATEATYDLLSKSAKQFPIVFDEIRRATLPGFPYSVYFRIRSTECLVIALLHGRRAPRRWQRR